MEVRLSSEQESFIEQNVRAGRFASADDAIRAAVELLEEHERELDELRAGVDAGDEDYAQGRYTEHTIESTPELFEELRRGSRAYRDQKAALRR